MSTKVARLRTGMGGGMLVDVMGHDECRMGVWQRVEKGVRNDGRACEYYMHR